MRVSIFVLVHVSDVWWSPYIGKVGQMAIPESIGNQFFARCFKVEQDAVAASDATASNQGTRSFPEFSYVTDEALQNEWKIVTVPKNAGECS